MQITVTEIRRVKHLVCDRCHTDITESGECVCDELSREELDALQTA